MNSILMPEIGDIILWQVTDKSPILSKAFAWWFTHFGQGGRPWLPSYSHSAVYNGFYDGSHHVYESTWPKTRLARIPNGDFNKYKLIVFRPEKYSKLQRVEVISWCSRNTGQWYDLLEIISLGLINVPWWMACSEFVKGAFKSANIHLGRRKEYLISPNEIRYETSGLVQVGELI